MMEDISNWGSSHEQLLTEIANLRNELAAAREEINEQARLNGMGGEREASLRAQLASRDLVIQQMREVLHDAGAVLDVCGQDFPSTIADIKAALFEITPTEALDAYVNKAVEEEREACAKVCEDEKTGAYMLDEVRNECAFEIRARGETK